MRVTIAAVGRMKSGPETDLATRYVDRFRKAGPQVGLEFARLVELVEARSPTVEERKRDEAQRLAAACPEAAFRVALDETGAALSSEEFAAALARQRDAGVRDLVLILGGPDGLDPAFRGNAQFVLSLGRLTLPHQIARILLAEQLYRAATIMAGHPYHRA